jgi:hypothetical protein
MVLNRQINYQLRRFLLGLCVIATIITVIAIIATKLLYGSIPAAGFDSSIRDNVAAVPASTNPENEIDIGDEEELLKLSSVPPDNNTTKNKLAAATTNGNKLKLTTSMDSIVRDFLTPNVRHYRQFDI